MALLLTWEEGAVSEAGFVVFRSSSALSLSYAKEPAGHLFHQVALKQHGIHGGLWIFFVCVVNS